MLPESAVGVGVADDARWSSLPHAATKNTPSSSRTFVEKVDDRKGDASFIFLIPHLHMALEPGSKHSPARLAAKLEGAAPSAPARAGWATRMTRRSGATKQ